MQSSGRSLVLQSEDGVENSLVVQEVSLLVEGFPRFLTQSDGERRGKNMDEEKRPDNTAAKRGAVRGNVE